MPEVVFCHALFSRLREEHVSIDDLAAKVWAGLLPVEAPHPEIQGLKGQVEMRQKQLANFESTPSPARVSSHSPDTGKQAATSVPVLQNGSTRLTKQDGGNSRSTAEALTATPATDEDESRRTAGGLQAEHECRLRICGGFRELFEAANIQGGTVPVPDTARSEYVRHLKFKFSDDQKQRRGSILEQVLLDTPLGKPRTIGHGLTTRLLSTSCVNNFKDFRSVTPRA